MPDWTSGADLSRWQARPEFDRLVDDGIKYVILKATQNMTVDPDFDFNRNEAEKRGMPHFAYAWLLPGDDDDVIEHFVAVVGKGTVAALDWEQAGVMARVTERWQDLIESELGREGLCYRGKWPPFPATPRIARWPWWYAQYPGTATAAPRVPIWDGTGTPDWSSEALIWQWTGAGREPGIATAIDLDRIACPWDVFKGWYDTGVWKGVDRPKPVPPPPPQLSATTDPITRTLIVGSSGRDVTKLQLRLSTLGLPVRADGEYGPFTRGAVAQFQRQHGLSVDGIAGQRTVAALGLR